MKVTDIQVKAMRKGIPIVCQECPCELNDDELLEAINEGIKEPICNDCYQDFFMEAFNEENRRHGA
jgi:hypothetical protein